MIIKILFHLLLWYHNTEVIFTAKEDGLSEATNVRSWFWSVGKMKGQTWRWDQDGGSWTAWKWAMRGRYGAGFLHSTDSKIGPYLEATLDRKQKSLQWTWRPDKDDQLSTACTEGIFNYTGSSGKFSLDIDGYILRNIRSAKVSSSNVCSLKPDENDSESNKKSSPDWVVDGRKICETVNTSNNADLDQFLIYVVLAQHPSSIPAITSHIRSKRQAAEEEEGVEGAAEETTTLITTTTTEEEDYDDDAPEPSFLDSIIEMIISFFTSIISFFM